MSPIMGFMIRLKWLTAVCLATLTGCGAIAYTTAFWARGLSYPKDKSVTEVAWYTPRAAVPGVAATPQQPAESDVTLSAEALDRAEAYAKARRSTAFLVQVQDRIVRERYAPGANDLTTTESKSMAKTVLSLAIGVAIHEKTIGSLDDSAAQYLTEWAQDDRRNITLRHLLQMTEGLAFDNDTGNPFSDMVRLHFASDMREVLLGIKPKRPPGQVFEYNNANSQLLVMILERATGQPYAAYLSEKIWKPLGCRDASLWIDREGGMAKGYCCLFTTARDWAKIGSLIAHRGRVGDRQVVPADWIDQMRQSSPLKADYGLHVWLGKTPLGKGSWDMVSLNGRSDQRVLVLPDQQLVVVRTGEEPADWDDFSLLDPLLAELRKLQP